MHAKSEKARARKLKRRLKALGAIGVALAAGTFLACQRGAETVKREVIDIRARAFGDAAATDAGADRDADETHARADGATEAATDGAGGRPRGRVRDAAVDVNEHRKGMPVRDNLLE